MKKEKEEKLLLIDTNSIIHRAFHALPPLKTKKGDPGGAVYGSLLAFFKTFSEINPQYIAAVFDSPGKTFRHKKYKEYKANREKAPDELISQIKKTKEVFSSLGICVLAKEGLEADDILGAVSNKFANEIEIVIVTGDMDILQLVNEKTKVYTLKRGVKESELYDIDKVKERYGGIGPEKIADIKALQGDASDNIPGVEGIGEKTAIKIIQKYGSIENLYKAIKEDKETVFSQKITEKLKEEEKKAFLSKELAVLNKKSFSDFSFCQFSFNKDSEKIKRVIDDLGFVSIGKRFLEEKSKKEEKKKENEKKGNLKFTFK